jgi:hypothetical protein
MVMRLAFGRQAVQFLWLRRKVSQTQDSTYRWMKKGGHVTVPIIEFLSLY